MVKFYCAKKYHLMVTCMMVPGMTVSVRRRKPWHTQKSGMICHTHFKTCVPWLPCAASHMYSLGSVQSNKMGTDPKIQGYYIFVIIPPHPNTSKHSFIESTLNFPSCSPLSLATPFPTPNHLNWSALTTKAKSMYLARISQ